MTLVQDILNKRQSPSADEERCTIIARVREFSNSLIHSPGETSEEFIDYDVSSVYFESHYPVTFYPNGRNGSTEGSVSVVFTKYYLKIRSIIRVRHAELTGVIAVIDAEGNRRFCQSFVICRDFSVPDPDPDLTVDDYVPREVLLRDPSEWLPEDTLTLHVDVVLRQNYLAISFWEIEFYQSLDTDFKTEEPADPETDDPADRYLSLDSYFAERLSLESRYFERLLVTPMVEMGSGWVRIPGEEFQRFVTIGRIMFDGGPVGFDSIDEIFDLYVTADKYGIDVVIDVCRRWLKLCLDFETVSEILEFVDEYKDDVLREDVEKFLKGGRMDVHEDDGSTRPMDDYWILDMNDPESGSRFEFRLNDEEKDQDKEKAAFEFYS